MKEYLPDFQKCLQHEPPFCLARCPFSLDVKAFIDKVQRGSFNSAYKLYRNAVGFPEIVSAICPRYCEEVCPMKEPIGLLDLEQSTLIHAKNTTPPDYNLPTKNGRIAIIGGGLSGLGCLLRLATKKYQVELFEKSSSLGGILKETHPHLPLMDFFNHQLQHEDYKIHYHHPITDLEELKSFDAVYVATGKDGPDLGLLRHDEEKCFLHGDEQKKIGVFGGGMLFGTDSVTALAHGLSAATTIDNFLKTGILTYAKEVTETRCILHEEKDLSPKKVPFSSQSYTKEEAQGEAHRCLQCQCDACRSHSDLVDFYNRWPLRIRDEVQATTLPGTSEVKATPAKRLINSDTLCGLFKEICPQKIDLDGLLLEARKSMHRQEKLPWAFYEFFLRDLEFTNGPLAGLVRAPQEKKTCEYAYFPGCQLGASQPELVMDSYETLLKVNKEVGLILRCCGIPALWAGDEDLHQRELEEVQQAWKSLGKPTLILACPSCHKYFSSHLPQISLTYYYDWLVEQRDPSEVSQPQSHGTRFPKGKTYHVFDPCAVKKDHPVRRHVRRLVQDHGGKVVPLKQQEKYPNCCGYGGHNAIANPEFHDRVAKKRMALGTQPYICYCINCRDAFLAQGKKAYHLFDLFYNKEPKLASVSARRDHRIRLKEYLLKKHWGETMKEKKTDYPFALEIQEELKEKLHQSRILEEDLMEVIDYCEKNNRRVYDQEKDTYSGYKKIGYATYWVEYRKKSDKAMVLLNGYAHRMEIEMEVVWNGKKREENL